MSQNPKTDFRVRDRSRASYCGMLLAMVLACWGCGRSAPPRVPVVPATGKVTVDGKPAGGAILMFYPKQPITGLKTRPLATTDADGSFAVGTYLAGDGLPVGEYAMTVTWPNRKIVEGEEILESDRLAGRFVDPAHPAQEVIVRDGTNEIPPIDLKGR